MRNSTSECITNVHCLLYLYNRKKFVGGEEEGGKEEFKSVVVNMNIYI